MQPKAEVKITHGKESMTKSGKIFSIFQLLQTVEGWINVEGTLVQFQPLELFRVRRGQRGAMSVELELGEDRFVPLGIGEDKQSLVVVEPITGSTLLMNWSRTSLEEQAKGLGSAADGEDRLLNTLLGDGPVESKWGNGKLNAVLHFQNPTDLQTLSEFRKEENFATRVFACIAHNVESLREPNSFALEFDVLLDQTNAYPHVIVIGDPCTVFRLDLDVNDMFAVSRFPAGSEEMPDGSKIRVRMSEVTRLTHDKQVEPTRIETKIASADYIPHSKQEGAEIEELLGESGLSNIIGNILANDVSPLARKWLNGYIVRVITAPAHYADKVLVERLNAREEAEGRGDIYHVGSRGEISLDRHRVRFEEFQGPMFSLENITFSEAAGEGRVFGGRQGYDTRGIVRRHVGAGLSREEERSDTPKRADLEVGLHREERPSKIPTREWIPQMNQCVFIEDDPKQEMYYIADYDQAEHKFLLIPADSLRRERMARQMPSGSKDHSLHNLNGQIPVEPGRLRPFVLFH
jgi:hypothetical protein